MSMVEGHLYRSGVLLLFLYSISLKNIGATEELLSNEDLAEFRNSKTPHAIFYYHHDEKSKQDFGSAMADIMYEADEAWRKLSSAYIKLALINCLGRHVRKDEIKECKPGHRVIYAYKQDREEKYTLKTLYGLEAFLGHMLFFVFENEIGIVQSQEDWEYEQNRERGNRDIVLMFFLGLGDKSHHALMMFAAPIIKEYKFVISTEKKFAVSLGMNSDHNCGLWYASCSQIIKESNDPCPLQQYSGYGFDINGAAIMSFVKLQGKPLVADLETNGSTVYGSTDINMFYIFVNNDVDHQAYTSIAENIINNLTGSGMHFRAAIVDQRIHVEHFPTFGIYESNIFPTMVVELPNEKRADDRQFESFIPDEDFTEENIQKFLLQFKEPKRVYEYIADLHEISVIKLADWIEGSYTIDRNVLAIGCTKDPAYEEPCMSFSVHARHLIRTIYDNSVLDISYFYVDFTDKPKSAEANKLPSMRLYTNNTEHILPEDQRHDYAAMLHWTNKILGLDMKPLPSSGSDFVSLPKKPTVDENEANLLGNDDELRDMEQDEITIDASKTRTKVFYEDAVDMLTDKTFNATLEKFELVVCLFYVPWDDRSYVFQPILERVSEKLGVDSEGSTISTKIAKMDCYSEHRSCMSEQMFTYPTIAIYRNKERIHLYDGILDEENVMKAIRLYQLPPLIELTEHTVMSHIDGLEPMPAASVVRKVVSGWFESENDDFKLYKKVAEAHYGKLLFVYGIGPTTKELLKARSSPFVEAFIFDEETRGSDEFAEPYNEEELNKFVKEILVPQFGELTANNFPWYKSLNQPFLLMLTKSEGRQEKVVWQAIAGIVRHRLLNNILTAWMNTDLAVVKAIRRSYLGKRKESLNELVIVNHTRGEVYLYSGPTDDPENCSKGVLKFIKYCERGVAKASAYLHAAKEWKPLRKGFDYLEYIEKGLPQNSISNEDEANDEEEAHAEVGNYGHYKPSDRAVFHGLKAPKKQKGAIDTYSSGPGELPDDEEELEVTRNGGEGDPKIINEIRHATDEL